ncbi:hypothetical protein ACFMJX_09375, partial [Acinetobacter baumannii]
MKLHQSRLVWLHQFCLWLTRKKEPKTKPKSRPLPKATQKYLEAEEDFTEALDNLEIKYEKKFQFKSTKH